MVLLGRDREQGAIDALLAGARVGEGSVLVLVGEPGIGKTALLQTAVASAEAGGFLLLRVAGSELERDLPFSGLAQLLAPLIPHVRDLPPPQSHALQVALALREGPAPDRFAVSAGVLGLVIRAAEESPVGIVIDDAHLVDPATAETVAFTSRRLQADQIFVLVAARSGTGPPWDARDLPHLQVGALAPVAARELARASSPRDLGPLLCDRVVEAAAGNPLAVREFAGHPEMLAEAQPVVPPPVTDTLATVFARRAGSLNDEAHEVLLLAAVAEGDLAVAGRAAAAGGLDLRLIEDAEKLGLVHPDGPARVEFVHPLARAAVYAKSEPATRRRLHALVADTLPDGQADRRAWHRAASVLGVDEAAAEDLSGVGRRASRRAAHAVAATAFDRAARLSPDPAAAARRFLAAGEAAWFAGDDPRATTLLQDGLRHGLCPGDQVRAEGLLGLVAARSGGLTQASTRLLSAAARAETTAPERAVLVYADAVDVCFYLLDVGRASDAAAAAQTLLDDPHHDISPTVRGVGWVAIGMARTLAGEAAGDALRRGVDLLAAAPGAQSGIVAQSGWDVLGSLFLRDSGSGGDLVEQALDRRREAASMGTLPHLLFHLARDHAASERWNSAAAEYGEAIGLARELGQHLELGVSLAGLAWLTAREGHDDRARSLADEALGLAREQRSRLAEAWCRFAISELDLAAGDAATAATGFAELAQWLEEVGAHDPDLSPVPELVEALCRIGRRDEAAEPAAAFLTRAVHKGRPWSLARAARVEGLLSSDARERDRHFARAARLHVQTPDRFEAARTALVYGELLRRDRQRNQAQPLLRRALTDFDALGARHWAERAAAELAASGLTARRRQTGPLFELTPREYQIAALLTQGNSTRQTAQALFLSPKTVEYHLRHVYTKLGVNSRAALADALLQLPG